jgi:hypothetical protein
MEVLYPRCCGLDVHKSSITACALIAQSGKPVKHIRRFGCTTCELRELVVWLQEFGVEHVAWNPQVFIGSQCGMFSKVIFKSCWQTHGTSRQFPDARQIRKSVSGSRSCLEFHCGDRGRLQFVPHCSASG